MNKKKPDPLGPYTNLKANGQSLTNERFMGAACATVHHGGLFGTRKEAENAARLFATSPQLKKQLESSVKMMTNALDNMAYLFSKNGPSALTPEAREWRKMLQKEVREARAVLSEIEPKD